MLTQGLTVIPVMAFYSSLIMQRVLIMEIAIFNLDVQRLVILKEWMGVHLFLIII